MAANNQPSRFSWHGVGQSVAAGLIMAGVLGTWNNSAETARQMADLNAAMTGMRRDVDRHESLLQQQSFNLMELRARLTGNSKPIY